MKRRMYLYKIVDQTGKRHRGGENDVGNISWFRHGVRSRSPGADLDRKQSDPVDQAAAEEIRD